MAQLLAPLAIASTGLTILGQLQNGKQANAAAKAEASQKEKLAGRERAAGQRQALAARREADIARSNAVAISAARSGSADGDAANLLARIDREGAFEVQTALGEGEARAQNRDFGAQMSRFDGKESQRRARLGALSTGVSFLSKFGGNLATGAYG